MNLPGALACALFVLAAGPGLACDIIFDPKPSWEEMIDEADVVFVGRMIAILPEDEIEWRERALFHVEIPVKGEVGAQFEVAQGMNSCTRSFDVGSRVIFAGTTSVLDDGYRFTSARDTGWDPTVNLSDPPTSEQQAQLDYLKTITEVR